MSYNFSNYDRTFYSQSSVFGTDVFHNHSWNAFDARTSKSIKNACSGGRDGWLLLADEKNIFLLLTSSICYKR